MTHSSVSVTIVVILVNLWQAVHLRKHNSRLCGPTVTADGVLLHGNDQIVLPNQQYNPENVSIVQFTFKTTSTEGLLLLYAGSESSTALQSLELVDGKLHFWVNFGPDSTVMISRERYNDGNWHELETKRTSEHLSMMLDGILVSTALVPENFNKTHDNSSVIYIGDFKETQHPSVTAKGFKGFVRNFRLGNVAVDLHSLIRKSSCHKRIRARRESGKNNCGADTDIHAIPVYVGATNIELSWSSSDCNMEYEVQIKDLGKDDIFRNYTTKDDHIEIKNLTRSVSYKFTLCGNLINVTTGSISSLIVDKVTESSIAIHWEVFGELSSEFKLAIFDETGREINSAEGANRHEFDNLKPESEYQLELSNVNKTWSNRTIKTKGVFLDNFNCSSSEYEGKINCSWGRGSGYYCGVNYHLNISESADSTVIHDPYLPNYDTTLYTTPRLRPGRKYSISIQYFASDNFISKVMNATAVAKTGISGYLLEQSISSSNHSFTINYFNDPDEEVEHYSIEVMNNSYVLSPYNSSILIDSLKAGHNYTVSAIAWSNGVGSEELSINVSTVPNPPSMVNCQKLSNTSLTVNISPPKEGSFDYYEISKNGETGEKRDESSTTVDKTITHVLVGLKPYTNYTIRVKYGMKFKTIHSQEKSERCETLQGIPDKVRDLINSTISATGFTITWKRPDPPNGVITGYVVRLYHREVIIRNYTTTERTLEITEEIFQQNPKQRSYKITVAAKTSVGEGDTLSLMITLLEVPPSQALLISALVILTILLVVLIGLLGYYFIRKSPSRMQSVRRISSRLMHPNNEVRYFKQPAVSSKPVKISDFVTYLEKLEKDSGLKLTEEYEDLKFVGRNQSKDDAELQCNRVKNRFTNILPYDISRVKLLAMEDEDGSDYINASWIPGFHSKREFIASQGPLPSTVDDFWRMIWENNCQAIVMLTLCIEKGHIKCEQYWPVQNEPVCYGDVKVEMQNEGKNEEWHTREFKISMGSQSRKLIHFHYVTWPDMYVPQRMSLIEFVREIRATLNKNNGKGPIVVHCSAGVGRSGTFIALDTLLHQILADHDLDVYGVVFQMRMNRVLMVQTEAQYTFIYECLKQILDEKNGQTEENTELENCREGVKKEETEASDSKEKQSQTGCTATESNLNSETKEKVQAKKPERNNDEAQDSSSSSIKDESSPKENAAKSESKSNLNSDERSSKNDGETKNLEISNQNLGDGKDNGR